MEAIEDEEQLRQLVIRARAVRGLTATGAAESSGISTQTWLNWESGDTGLTPRVKNAIALSFGWDTDWPWNPPAADAGTIRRSVDQKLDDVLEQLAALTEAVRRLAPPR